jgi:hypothetical protein
VRRELELEVQQEPAAVERQVPARELELELVEQRAAVPAGQVVHARVVPLALASLRAVAAAVAHRHSSPLPHVTKATHQPSGWLPEFDFEREHDQARFASPPPRLLASGDR